jgi:23S rRNA (cytidine1920-2'-O)/16S rRNA (cytidine1409-2'-O)-methyltransferase
MSSASPTKQRLDQLLVERGLVESRSRAQALVMSGKVFSGEVRLDKPGQQVSGDIAIDVGRGQLDWSLRNDERVVVFEGTNARYLTEAEITDGPSLIVCDASFIGLRTVLPASLALVGEGAHLVALIKPQFEVGKGRVGKGGVVRDPALHEEACETIRYWLAEEMGWTVLGIVKSPITGPKGNIEFLIVARKPA